MKTRIGFVSNSSSSSFMIPSSFLTDEQKEAVFFCLSDGRKTKIEINKKLNIFSEEDLYPEKGLPRNESYHEIFKQMKKDNKWDDYGWDSRYSPAYLSLKKGEFIQGGCDMWNGSLEIFFKKIGIDVTALEIVGGHGSVDMPSNPEALKIFSKLREEIIKENAKLKQEFDKIPEDDDERIFHDFHMNFEEKEITDNPYSLPEDQFKEWHDNLIFESTDGNTYWKPKSKDGTPEEKSI